MAAEPNQLRNRPSVTQPAPAAGLRHQLSNAIFPLRAELEATGTLAMPAEVRARVHSMLAHVRRLQEIVDRASRPGPDPAVDGPSRGGPPRGGAPSADGAAVRVLCVDDHETLVEGLRAKFAAEGRVCIVGSLRTADRLGEEADRLHPDIILLDVEMPGADVFEQADRLHRAHPGQRFVFLSAHVGDGAVAAAYKCGASGYFTKGDDLDDIVAGLGRVARNPTGMFVMSPRVKAHCGGAAGRAGGDGPVTALASLSARELEVLRLIGKGRSREQIAAELCRSIKTIDRHQERVSKKLGVRTRADLIRYAIREGLSHA